MQKSNKISLVVFFTYGQSLQKWKESGLINRELALYDRLAQQIQHIYFVTYGSKDQECIPKSLKNKITVLQNHRNVPNFLYSLFIPLLHRNTLRSLTTKNTILKSNQIVGSWASVLCKWMYQLPFIARQGYTESLFSKQQGRNFLFRSLIYLIESFAFKNANYIVVSATKDGQYIKKRYSPHGEVHTIQNFVDEKTFSPRKATSNALLTIGRLHEQKNLFALIDACAKTKQKLIIIGKGELQKDLKQHAQSVGTQVDFLGAVDHNDLPKHINSCGIYIQPSLIEGNPKTIIEAMSCGRAIIASNVAGTKDIITHGQNGYLCGTSANEIAKAIDSVSKNKALQKKLGEQARSYVMQNNALTTVVKKELEIYDKLLK